MGGGSAGNSRAEPGKVSADKVMLAGRRQRLRASIFADARAISPPLLMPFETVLDLLGENIGPRLLFVRTNHQDSEDHGLCLRPDLTLPAALAFAAAPDTGAGHSVAYEGPAFRLGLESRAPEEFAQIGREIFNGSGDVTEDLDLFARALAGAMAGGAVKLRVQISDMALLSALIADLPLSADWRGRLSRRLGRPTALTDLLRAGIRAADAPLPARTLDEAGLAFEAQAGAPLAGRTQAEIIARAATRGANDPLPREIAAVLSTFFSLRGPFEPILQQAAFLVPGARRVEEALARTRAFCLGAEELLTSCGAKEREMVFSTKSGGAFDYYDGMVFAFTSATGTDGAMVSIGGGGRYDQLIGHLSNGARHAKAAGFALRPDRLGLTVAEPGS